MIHRRFHTSDLSLQTSSGKWSVHMSQYDEGHFTFDHEAAYDTVAVKLFDATTGDLLTVNAIVELVPTGPQLEVDESSNTAVVTISGLTRTMVYELVVIFTESDDHTDTYTLAIECVA